MIESASSSSTTSVDAVGRNIVSRPPSAGAAFPASSYSLILEPSPTNSDPHFKKSPAFVACDACHVQKKKCTREIPCQSCVNKKIPCTRVRAALTSTANTGKRKEPEPEVSKSVRVYDELVALDVLARIKAAFQHCIISGLVFSDDLTMSDPEKLYSTPARRVLVDNILSFCAQGIGLKDLSANLRQRSIRGATEIMTEFSNESAAALYSVGLTFYGTDAAKVRHYLRAALSVFKEANPGINTDLWYRTSSAESMFLLVSHTSHLFFQKPIGGMFLELHFHTRTMAPTACWNMREILKANNISDNLGPFDVAGYVGAPLVREQEESPSQRAAYAVIASELLPNVDAFLTRNYEKMETEQAYGLVQMMTLVIKMILHYQKGEFVNCALVASEILKKMENYPPPLLSYTVVAFLVHVLEVAILLQRPDLFSRGRNIAAAMYSVPAAFAVYKSIKDIEIARSPLHEGEASLQTPELSFVDEQDDQAKRYFQVEDVGDTGDFTAFDEYSGTAAMDQLISSPLEYFEEVDS